jgi:hypothetical protein
MKSMATKINNLFQIIKKGSNMNAEFLLNEAMCKLAVVSATLWRLEESLPDGCSRTFIDSLSGARIITDDAKDLVLKADLNFTETCKACPSDGSKLPKIKTCQTGKSCCQE